MVIKIGKVGVGRYFGEGYLIVTGPQLFNVAAIDVMVSSGVLYMIRYEYVECVHILQILLIRHMDFQAKISHG